MSTRRGERERESPMLSFSPLYSASPTPLVREISKFTPMSLVKVEKYQHLSFILIGLLLESYQSINSIPIGLMVDNVRYCIILYWHLTSQP